MTDYDWNATEWSEWTLTVATQTATRGRWCQRKDGQSYVPPGVGQCRPMPHYQAVDCKEKHENCHVPFTPWSEWTDCMTPCDSDLGKKNRHEF